MYPQMYYIIDIFFPNNVHNERFCSPTIRSLCTVHYLGKIRPRFIWETGLAWTDPAHGYCCLITDNGTLINIHLMEILWITLQHTLLQANALLELCVMAHGAARGLYVGGKNPSFLHFFHFVPHFFMF